MKIYFVASPRAISTEGKLFREMYNYLNKNNVMTSDLLMKLDDKNVGDFYGAGHEQVVEHYKRTISAVKRANFVIVEVSLHSMSMGYIVNKSLELNKPVVALYKKGFEPYFFGGIENERLRTIEYKPENYKKALDEAVEFGKGGSDVRFNFFVSPKILAYLDWVAKTRRLPRSVFLRNLIEKEMKKDKSFRG